MPRASRYTHGSPVSRSRASIARRHDVAGREIAHRMHPGGDRIPLPSSRIAPSPRTRFGDQRAPAAAWPSNSMVGWNWMNSMSLTGTPAHSASATPSPVEPSGIGGALIQMPEPAGRQDHRRGVHDAEARPR
jgi:hypothetical protein